MFVGHYGASFAAKSLNKSIPLSILFSAVQLIDVLWAIFVILGIEKVRIVPGITATNPLDLYYMPYTHSLVAAILWAVAAAIVYRILSRRNNWTMASIVGAARTFQNDKRRYRFGHIQLNPDEPKARDVLELSPLASRLSSICNLVPRHHPSTSSSRSLMRLAQESQMSKEK
jgi:hypothetical protein